MNLTMGAHSDRFSVRAMVLTAEISHGISLLDFVCRNLESEERQSVEGLLEMAEDRYTTIADEITNIGDEPLFAQAQEQLLKLRTKIDGLRLASQLQQTR